MRKARLEHSAGVINSPFLLPILICAAIALAITLNKVLAADRAPTIAGYEWSKHPEALLVVYPLADACSTCNLSITGWAERGLQHQLDVLIIASRPNRELKEIRKYLPRADEVRLSVITGVDEEVIRKFSRDDKIGGVRIHQGRIHARQVGGSPTDKFLDNRK